MKRARARRKRTHKKLKIFFVSLLTVITAFVVVLGFHSVLFPMTDTTNDNSMVVPVDKATGKINILLLGVDNDGLRTDTIILASYDLDNDRINMLSIPRDTRMYVGKRFQKINAAHSITGKDGKVKGVDGAIEAVTRLTGMPINYYVEFSFAAFRNTIDALGGVEFDVPQRMKYSDPVQDLYIDLQAGLQMLDGDKAEQLVRFRKYELGDIKRVETQQSFIKAIAEQKLNLGIITKLPDLFKVLEKDIKTNFRMSDVVRYIPNLKDLSAENVTMYQLPGNFSGEEYKASYWLPDMTALKTLVVDTFGYPDANPRTDADGVVDTGADKTKPTPKPTATPKATPKPTATPEEDDFIEIPDSTPKPTDTPLKDTAEETTDNLKETKE